MRKQYKELLEKGSFGSLGDIIDIETLSFNEGLNEDNLLKAIFSFILENLEEEKVSCQELVKRAVIIEKLLASEINGKFITKGGKRFQAFGREDHYEVRLMNYLKDLGIKYLPELMLSKEELKKVIAQMFSKLRK